MSALAQTLNTEWGEITVEIEGGGYRPLKHVYRLDDYSMEFDCPSVGEEPEGATVLFRRGGGYRYMSETDLVFTARLTQFAAWLTGSFNHAIREALQDQARIEAEEEEARLEAERIAKEREDERAEIMLQELVGERVKVRHRGYKTMCYGDVYVLGDGSEHNPYRPKIRYTDQGISRDQGVESYRRLDAKTERGWRTVWDDGKDDLPEYDRAVKLPELKPYN